MHDNYQQRLAHLTSAHQLLNKRIDGLEKTGVFEDQQLTALKQQRLALKQQIAEIQANITKNS